MGSQPVASYSQFSSLYGYVDKLQGHSVPRLAASLQSTKQPRRKIMIDLTRCNERDYVETESEDYSEFFDGQSIFYSDEEGAKKRRSHGLHHRAQKSTFEAKIHSKAKVAGNVKVAVDSRPASRIQTEKK